MITQEITLTDIHAIADYIYEIPQKFRSDMRVPARIFADKFLLDAIVKDRSLWQLINVTTLPGIVGRALAMPDIHQGYGFPIGGVAAVSLADGVISPGGIGYDINCGIRLMGTPLTIGEIRSKIDVLATALFNAVPSGAGVGGKHTFKGGQLEALLAQGAPYLLKQGYGEPLDLTHCEEGGCLSAADADKVSDHAKKRAIDQIGTLGAGNHFLEIQYVEEIIDEAVARSFGLFAGQVVIMIHCGSRGLGHQVCTDYVRTMVSKLDSWHITLPDRELACAPFYSEQGQDYFKAMAAAANFAWANRHMIGHRIRQAVQALFDKKTNVWTMYDVSHNIGKIEEHVIDGKKQQVLVHRKGATRAFGAHHPAVATTYQEVGQPVFIPGTMGTSSYVLVGTQRAMELSLGSTCHGAGRAWSRTHAQQALSGLQVRKELEKKGIIIRCRSDNELSQEAPSAYKDVDNVVNVVHEVGIATKVVRLKPVAVIKG